VASTSILLKQFPWLDLQAIRDPRDVIDGNITLGALDRAQVCPIEAALMSQGFLAQPAHGTELAHVLRQNISEGAFVRPLHERNPADC
jgi:hypothetical protein